MLGIGLSTYVDNTLATILLTLVFLIYSSFVFLIPKTFFSRYHPWIAGLAIVAFALLGILRTQQYDKSRDPTHLVNHTDSADYYLANVISEPESKKNSFKVLLEVEQVLIAGEKTSLRSGQVIAYQPKSDSCQLLHFGDKIIVRGLPDTVKSPQNPAEFNYQQFLAYQGIYHQQYLPADRWKIVQTGAMPSWRGWTEKWRNRCEQALSRHISDRRARGIALAITLGLKSHLEKEVQAAYSAAGAMHVLAVSGLHVGIIYLIINFLFKPLLQLSRLGTVLHTILCLLTLWAYAALTGFSPSVQRAVVMFSFVIIGSALNRQSSIYNTLACSALALLWVNPYLMYSVGFQLSYLAVFGIVYLQPRIAAQWQPTSMVMSWVWKITAVSLAAQVATFPLSIYYFHQFPVYFWLSNIVVIPGALAMLPLGLVTIVADFMFPILAKWSGLVLEKLILLINFLVKLVQKIPNSTVDSIFIDIAQTWLVYSVLASLVAFVYFRRLRFLSLAIVALLLLVTRQLSRYYQQSEEESFTVYYIKGETHLDFTQGFSNLHWGEWNTNAEYSILPNHVQKGVLTKLVSEKTHNERLYHRSVNGVTLFRYQGNVIALIEESLDSGLENPIAVDYVILAKNAIRDLAQLDKYFRYDRLIVDGSNSLYTAKKLTEQAKQKHISTHSVPVQGALTINLKP